MTIEKVFLNGKEIKLSQAKKYIQSELTLECLFGGIAIKTPDGILEAEVSLR